MINRELLMDILFVFFSLMLILFFVSRLSKFERKGIAFAFVVAGIQTVFISIGVILLDIFKVPDSLSIILTGYSILILVLFISIKIFYKISWKDAILTFFATIGVFSQVLIIWIILKNILSPPPMINIA